MFRRFNVTTTLTSKIFGVTKIIHYWDGILIPNKAIKGNKIYKVTVIDNTYKIPALTVTTVNDKLKFVHAYASHPNIDPSNLLYCLAPHYKDTDYDEKMYQTLLSLLSTYYLDNCFYDVMQTKNQLIFEEQPSLRFNGKGEVISNGWK